MTAWLFNKLWINRQFYTSQQTLEGKTVLITGANTGIGYETAKDLLRRSLFSSLLFLCFSLRINSVFFLEARVIIACRNLNKGYQAVNKLISETGCSSNNIQLMECDLCSLISIRKFVTLYNETEERLDILICNAGLGWSPPSRMTQDGFHPVIQANYLGHFLLTQLLLDKLKECRPSRIINVSSKLHQSNQIIIIIIFVSRLIFRSAIDRLVRCFYTVT